MSHAIETNRKAPTNNRLAFLLVSPAMAVLLPFAILPFFYALYLSLFDFEGNVAQYIGDLHYRAAFQDAGFWGAVKVTLYFAIGTVLPSLGISIVLALVLSQIRRLQSFLRTVYFLPFITSVVAAAMIWRAMFEPINGPMTQLLILFGLEPQRWLLEPRGLLSIITKGAIDPSIGPSLALCCVMVFEIWRSIGFMIVILLAALTQRSKELEEAATLEGATRTQLARHIILPGIAPTLVFLFVITTIQSFQAFNGFFALTGDGRGPLDTTQNMTVYIYTQFYEYGHIGYGSASAVILSVAIMLFTLLQLRLTRARSDES